MSTEWICVGFKTLLKRTNLFNHLRNLVHLQHKVYNHPNMYVQECFLSFGKFISKIQANGFVCYLLNGIYKCLVAYFECYAIKNIVLYKICPKNAVLVKYFFKEPDHLHYVKPWNEILKMDFPPTFLSVKIKMKSNI